MAATVWNPGWVQEHTQPLAMHAFRMVETQHIAATMRLVDTAAEQDLLEQMLDASKPPLPLEAQGIHYLLAAPFRYLPPTGSRFRSAHMPGTLASRLRQSLERRESVRNSSGRASG